MDVFPASTWKPSIERGGLTPVLACRRLPLSSGVRWTPDLRTEGIRPLNELHAAALDLAATQSGVITRAQARRAGLSAGAIDGCLANGLFRSVAHHVYRTAGTPQSESMAVTAAALGTGGRASHVSAARRLQLESDLPVSPIHTSVDAQRCRPRLRRVEVETVHHSFFSVVVHRSVSLAERVPTIDGIPCASADQVLIEIAPLLSAEHLEAVFERARRLGLVSTERLAWRFGEIGGRGRPGTPKIRELLAQAQPTALDSRLEVKAWRMLRASRLTDPVRQLRVDLPANRWYRLDFAWPELLVAFETEGFEWHGYRARWKQDRIRTAGLERLGWRIVVATWDDVVSAPAATVERIAMALSERRALIAAG